MPYGLWDVSGKKLGSSGGGADAALSADTSFETLTETMSIDDFVQRCGTKVDFIKLDIEGAELNALRGAERTLRQFRPGLRSASTIQCWISFASRAISTA